MVSSDRRVTHDLGSYIVISEAFADSSGCSRRQDHFLEAVGRLDESIETSLSTMV